LKEPTQQKVVEGGHHGLDMVDFMAMNGSLGQMGVEEFEGDEVPKEKKKWGILNNS